MQANPISLVNFQNRMPSELGGVEKFRQILPVNPREDRRAASDQTLHLRCLPPRSDKVNDSL